MNKSKIKTLIRGCALIALSASINVYAEGSRYDLPREYLSEISSAKAYLNMNTEKATLIDVRRLREYAAGHPVKAFNVPFPHIAGRNDQDASVFYWAVHGIVGGNPDAPIMTLSRTGKHSARAANILANPDAYEIDGPAFTNVRNIWEGFVGRYKEPNVGGETIPNSFLDLNNNDVLDNDVADANPDKDGWRNYQELPWNTKLHVNRVYLNDLSQYDPSPVTSVEVITVSGAIMSLEGSWDTPCDTHNKGTPEAWDSRNTRVFSGTSVIFTLSSYSSSDGTCTGTQTAIQVFDLTATLPGTVGEIAGWVEYGGLPVSAPLAQDGSEPLSDNEPVTLLTFTINSVTPPIPDIPTEVGGFFVVDDTVTNVPVMYINSGPGETTASFIPHTRQ